MEMNKNCNTIKKAIERGGGGNGEEWGGDATPNCVISALCTSQCAKGNLKHHNMWKNVIFSSYALVPTSTHYPIILE